MGAKIVIIVRSVYIDTKARYKLGNIETNWVKREREVRQGCILSPESRSKVCQMCDMGDDEAMEHVVLECEKYDRDRMKMMRVILT